MIMEGAPVFAKGRGFSRPPPVKKPGSQYPLRFDSIIEDLSNRIRTMEINDGEMDSLKGSLKDICETEELLKLAVDNLFTNARKNRAMCHKLGAVFAHYQKESAGSTVMRTVVLKRAQKDFEDRHEIRAESDVEAVNCAVLLCQIFQHMRVVKTNQEGEVMGVEPVVTLAVPVCAYMDDLFNPQASEDSIVEGARQLILNGQNIEKCNAEKVKELLRNVRVMLVNKPLSTLARCHLLYALEYALRGWEHPPDIAVYRDNGFKLTPSSIESPSQIVQAASSLTNNYSQQQSIRPVDNNSMTRAAVAEYNDSYESIKTSPPPNYERAANHGTTSDIQQRSKYSMPYTDVRKILAAQQKEQAQLNRSSSMDEWNGAPRLNQEQKFDTPPPNFADSSGQQRGRPIFKGRGFTNEMPVMRPGRQENDNWPAERGPKSVDEAWGSSSNRKHWFQHDVRGEEEDNESDKGSQWRGNRGDDDRRGHDRNPQWRSNRGGDGRRGNDSSSWRDNRKGRSDSGSWRGNDDRKGEQNAALNSPLPDDDQEVW